LPRSYGADNLRFLAGVRSLAYVTASRTHFMLRERTPIKVVLYAIYLYLSDPEPKTNSKNTNINRREKKP